MGLPETIGRYEVVGELASGGMAEILLARIRGPNGFERPVVVKRILPHLAREKTFRDMFLDEARIVAGILHPNVVQVQELGHEGDELFLAMEYLEGESVSGLMKRLVATQARVDVALAGHIVASACAGLHAAHELKDPEGAPMNLVHRDISPQNIFVTYAGQVKVLDFGIAKAADRITRTETGVVKGKHEYMSPEQCLGKPLDRRSDIFALGVVLYELVAGKRLFRRDNQMAALNAICNEPIPSLTEAAPWADRRIEAVCIRALARRREERFESAAEMRRELLAALHGIGAGIDFDEALGSLMRTLFASRIEEKHEMLRRVRAGSVLTHVPAGEVDLSVDMPIVTAATESASRWEAGIVPAPPPSPGRRRSALLGGGILAAAALTTVLVVGLRPTRSTLTSAAASVAPAPVEPPPAVTAAPTAASAPPTAEVKIHVETSPPAARVIVDGTDRGATPLDTRVLRGDAAIQLEIKKPGYAPLLQSLVPSTDQRLVLSLSPAVTPPARRPATAPGKPTLAAPPTAPTATETPPSAFRRFD